MANTILLLSALCCGAFHLWALLSFQTFLAATTWACAILGGIVTSIFNHASTSQIAKWMDRLVIACCVGLDAAILAAAAYTRTHTQTPLPTLLGCYVVLVAAVGLYFTAKKYEHTHKCHKRRDYCHAGSHILATVLHVSMAALVLVPATSN
jgi:hypothetical protein